MDNQTHRIEVLIPKLGGRIEVESPDKEFVTKEFARLAREYFKSDNAVDDSIAVPQTNPNEELLPSLKKDISLEEFVRKVGFRDGTQLLLVVGYFFENVEHKQSFTSNEIVQAFKRIKHNHKNPYQIIANARVGGLLMEGPEGRRSIQLSSTGEERVKSLMATKGIES